VNNEKVITNTNPVLPKAAPPTPAPEYDTKMVILTIATFVLGLASVLALLFFLRIRNQDTQMAPKVTDQEMAQNVDIPVEKLPEASAKPTVDSNKAVLELDQMDIDSISSYYSDETFENGLE